jgi:4-amino-4-deoxy-L-arabinose transferase-like glycosyltransferase
LAREIAADGTIAAVPIRTILTTERARVTKRTPRGWLRWLAAPPLPARVSRVLANPRAPLVLLGLVGVVAVGVRAYRLGTPVAKPPNQGYIFDERYYVSAARVIAGERVTRGDVYFHAAPKGADPNAEHPQLGKVIIAASIDLFGDNAIGWRISAVLFGVASILLLYWLVRCAGGSSWLALGAASLAGFDNLWLVHSRIAVLDIYVVPFMLAATALYLRRRPVLAGLAIGIGCCVKEFAAYTALVLFLLEVLRACARIFGERDRVRSALAQLLPALAACVVAAVTFFSLLSILDSAFPPYNDGHRVDRHQAAVCKHLLIWRSGCNHFAFMNHYAATLTDHGRPKGIATVPTGWWLNRKVINYYGTSVIVKSGERVTATRPILAFKGEISRVLLFTAWLALAMSAWWAVRRRDTASLLTVAWVLGTWLPPELFHVIDQRTTYLYYMVVTMPALYLAVARLLAVKRLPWLLAAIWVAAFLWDFTSLYPFRQAISL